MKRIRNLGLAALAALALTAAAGVSSAGAAGFVAGQYPASVSLTESPETTFEFSSGTAWCASPGEYLAQGTLAKAHESISTTVEQANCTIQQAGYSEGVLEMKGCKYILHPTAPGAGSFDIGPPGCGPVVINRTNSSCDWTLSPTSNLSAAYTNQPAAGGTPSMVAVAPHAEGSIPYTFGCSGKGLATLEADWQLKAFNEAGAQIDLSVERDGFFFNSGASLFEAEAYPLEVSGSQDSTNKHALSLGSRVIVCENVTFDDQVTGAASTLTVDAEYSGCTTKPVLGVVLTAYFETEGCGFALNASGTVDVVCDEAGDAIEIELQNKGSRVCLEKIPPQKGIGSVTYGTVGEGINRGVSVGLNLKGISGSIEGSALVCGKIGTSGTYTGSTTLRGPQ